MAVSGVSVRSFTATGGDDAVAMQAAIDYAETQVVASTAVPTVFVPPGTYHWKTAVTWKSCNIVATGPITSVQILWDGTAGATALTKSNSVAFPSTGYLRNLTFTEGLTEPGTWLDLTAVTGDKYLKLKDVQFAECSSDAIKLGAWVNLHWEDLRFDNVGGYMIRATPPLASGQFLSSFRLDGFTYDHSRASGPASGMILVDNTANLANLGVFAVENGRIEVNTAWTGNKAILQLTLPAGSPNPSTVGFRLENVTYQDDASMAGDVALYQSSAGATGLVPSLILDNFRQSNLAAILGGTFIAKAQPPLQTNYGYQAIGHGDPVSHVGADLEVRNTSFPAVLLNHTGVGVVAGLTSDTDGNAYHDAARTAGGTGDHIFRTGSGFTVRARVRSSDGGLQLEGPLDHNGSTVGFYGVTPATRPTAYTQTFSTADKTLAAYTPDAESAAYTGAADGEAKLADLNALRVAVENLRAHAEDTAQLLNAVIDDLQTLGILQ